MALQSGSLLLNRRRLSLEVGATPVDTQLRQTEHNFAPDPPLFGLLTVASRVMVVPLPPLTSWTGVRHTEPYEGPNGNVWVDFEVQGSPTTLNVLFWDPHTFICPVSAAPYRSEGCLQTATINLFQTSCTISVPQL